MSNIKLWVIDEKTYNEVQKLKSFVDLVSGLKQCEANSKALLNAIKLRIENINKPETFKDWSILIDIHLEDENNPIKTPHSYLRRTWSIFFEMNTLSMDAASVYTDDPAGLDNEEIYYSGTIYFDLNLPDDCRQEYLDEDLDIFTQSLIQFLENNKMPIWGFEVDVDLIE